jgi:hypothetical protein
MASFLSRYKSFRASQSELFLGLFLPGNLRSPWSHILRFHILQAWSQLTPSDSHPTSTSLFKRFCFWFVSGFPDATWVASTSHVSQSGLAPGHLNLDLFSWTPLEMSSMADVAVGSPQMLINYLKKFREIFLIPLPDSSSYLHLIHLTPEGDKSPWLRESRIRGCAFSQFSRRSPPRRRKARGEGWLKCPLPSRCRPTQTVALLLLKIKK